MAKSFLRGNNYNYTNSDGRMYLQYTIITLIITLYQIPFYFIYTTIVSPFHLVSRKMELRADKKAYSLLKSNKILKSLNIDIEESIKSYFKFLIETKMSLFSPSVFEATMGNHPNPVER
jgi:Zn-dependent protease with chaperone function